MKPSRWVSDDQEDSIPHYLPGDGDVREEVAAVGDLQSIRSCQVEVEALIVLVAGAELEVPLVIALCDRADLRAGIH